MVDFTAARLNMVESQVRTNDVTDVRVQDAMRVIARETLVPAGKAYLAYADAHPDGYRLLHGGALQTDPEIKERVEQTRAQIERAVLAHLRITNATEVERLAVRGWIGSVIAVCMEWVGQGQPSRRAVHALLLQTLPARTDPDEE